MKRAAHGVRGIKLKTGDVVVGAGVLESDESEAQVFTILKKAMVNATKRMRTMYKNAAASVQRTSVLTTKLAM